MIQVVYPVCGNGLVYCPLTDGCEKTCSAGLDTLALSPDYKHSCKGRESFCGNEEACTSGVKRPDSFSGKI